MKFNSIYSLAFESFMRYFFKKKRIDYVKIFNSYNELLVTMNFY